MSQPATLKVQRAANDITARLAQVVKRSPDLASYLQVHADCLINALGPRGLSYEMLNGSGFQQVLGKNLEDLNLKKMPDQADCFRRVVHEVAAKKVPALIAPHTFPAGGKHSEGVRVEDAPVLDHVPYFNKTAFQQLFVPIPVDDKVVGVLQIWFSDGDTEQGKLRLTLLQAACNEVELYFKARQSADVSQELSRLNTYIHLLEELSGDLDFETTSWNLVNYARESVDCERVCLFSVAHYRKNGWRKLDRPEDYTFEIRACSGLKRPHPRSEHAEILKGVAGRLFEYVVPENDFAGLRTSAAKEIESEELDEESAKEGSENADTEAGISPATTVESGKSGGNNESNGRNDGNGKGLLSIPPTERAKFPLVLTQRDPAKVDSRPDEINTYFDTIPMNWATVVPLLDRDYEVCGLFLFEGRNKSERMRAHFSHMRDLSISGGRAFGTALYWHERTSLRLVRHWHNLMERQNGSSVRKLVFKVLVPTLAVLGVLAMPFKHSIDGEATLVSKHYRSLPALTSARLSEIQVREGESVAEGQVLARLDTYDLEMQLRQEAQDYERYMAEADRAQSLGEEALMQISRLNARKILARVEKLQTDIRNATILAPFDGVVVGPKNLTQMIGKVLRMGEPIIEIADPHDWEVKVLVSEPDLVQLDRTYQASGAISGQLKLAADPTMGFPLEIRDASDFAYGLRAENGTYGFGLVLPIASNEADPELFKLGLGGRATFDCGRKSVAYILFHDFSNFLKLRFF